jgi:hypothetical protein
MKKVLIAVTFLIALSGCSDTSADPLPTASKTDLTSEKLQPSSLKGLEVSTYVIDANEYWETIDAIKMTTSKDADAVSIAIANTVNEYIAGRIEEFQDEVMGNKKTKYNSKFAKEFFLVYDESTVSKNVYAITISDDSYRGMAHNTSQSRTFAFDKRTGDQIILRNEIEPSKSQAFDEFILATLKEQAPNDIFGSKEVLTTLKKSDEYTAWFASKKDGLAIIFREYAVGPYSSGQIAIGVGWDEVKQYFKTDSVLVSEFAE